MTMGGGRIGTASLGALTGEWTIVKSTCTHLDMPSCYPSSFSTYTACLEMITFMLSTSWGSCSLLCLALP